MKIFAYRKNGARALGLYDGKRHFDLGGALVRARLPEDEIALIEKGFFRKSSLESFLGKAGALPEIPGAPEFDLPVAKPGKILAIGKNFAAHAAEFGSEAPEEPLFFAKLENALLPHGKPIPIPRWLASRVDHEAELALIVGRDGKHIPESRAFDWVAGYTVLNDVTARKMQGEDRKQGHPWLRSKSLDGSAPCGPYWVPADFLPDPASCRIECRVNGEVRQKGLVSEMVHPIPKILSYLSRFLTLHAGDLVALGTPSGVGTIQPGDVVECEVSGIGVLRNPVVREKLREREAVSLDKEKLFAELRPRLERALAEARDREQRYAKAVEILHASLPHFHWTGIYLLEGDVLALGPFRGKPTEHVRIPVGRGICGRAVAEKRSLVVEDVAREANYLACSIETRAEIVVPIRFGGNIVGEIDVDSDLPAAFDGRDREFLERVAGLLGA